VTGSQGSPALWDLGELASAIRDRRISSRELLGEYLRRVEAINPSLNAIVTTDAERALDAAYRADQATARGSLRGPLHGLPATIKDAIATAGIRSTGGATELAEHVPTVDPPAIQRLRQAGAIIYGKSNLPRWSGDIQTYNDLFGTTSNPWDLERTPGGSSGGAAAAVAAGLTSFELGTDIGGSIRNPSGHCGVFGHKPSFGIVPQQGYLNPVLEPDINVFGPIARSAADLATVLDVLAGPAGEQAKAWSLRLPPPRHSDLRDYRVGLWLDDPAAQVATDVGDVLSAAADALARASVRVSSAHPAIDLAEARTVYMSLMQASMPVPPSSGVAEAIGSSHSVWLDHHRARNAMRAAWAEWFGDFDVLLCPVFPTAAFRHDHSGTIADRILMINGRPRTHLDATTWTVSISAAYLPSTAVPAGFTPDGLPVGVQVVGPYLEDRTCLFAGAGLASLTCGYVVPPAACSLPGGVGAATA
jgi:amidase